MAREGRSRVTKQPSGVTSVEATAATTYLPPEGDIDLTPGELPCVTTYLIN